MPKFAATTAVPVAQTKGDIAAVIGRFNGRLDDIDERVAGRVTIMFRTNNNPPRHLRVTTHMPIKVDSQASRRKWRALFNDIKFKFVSVDEDIETFDQAFMAWIVGSDGQTFFEKAQDAGWFTLLPAS